MRRLRRRRVGRSRRGWSLSGIDAGEYSRLLMIMSKLFSESARTPPTPSQIMHSAYNQTQVRDVPPLWEPLPSFRRQHLPVYEMFHEWNRFPRTFCGACRPTRR